MCESTTCDEHDDFDEGLGLRAWNAGMARALWPNNSRNYTTHVSFGSGGNSSLLLQNVTAPQPFVASMRAQQAAATLAAAGVGAVAMGVVAAGAVAFEKEVPAVPEAAAGTTYANAGADEQ